MIMLQLLADADLPKELAIAIGEFSQTISDLAASDVGDSLSQALEGLANVEKRAQDIQNKQSREDIMTIMSTSESTMFIVCG
jgi:sorting nexin-1/2